VTPVSETVNLVPPEKEALVSIDSSNLLVSVDDNEDNVPWLGGLVIWLPRVAAEKNPKKEFQLDIDENWGLRFTVVNNEDFLRNSGAADKFTL
jgi:hypothetical protein